MAFLTRYSRPIEQIFFPEQNDQLFKDQVIFVLDSCVFCTLLNIQMDNNSKYYYETVKYCKCIFFLIL